MCYAALFCIFRACFSVVARTGAIKFYPSKFMSKFIEPGDGMGEIRISGSTERQDSAGRLSGSSQVAFFGGQFANRPYM